MNLLKKLPIFFLLLFSFTACKKAKFESTGKLIFNFKNGIPACYTLYTEDAYYSTTRLSILNYPGGSEAGLKVDWNGNTMTIEGLNYGTYVFSGCAVGLKVVQVAAGATKTYEL